MRQRAFNLLVVVSLVMLTATTALWVMSYRRFMTLRLPTRPGSAGWVANCYRGNISLAMIDNMPRALPFYLGIVRDTGPADLWEAEGGRRTWMGFAVTKRSIAFKAVQPGVIHRRIELLLPIWFLFGMTTLPLLGARRLWRRMMNRQAAGQCVNCGYDLRATPDCCPECGTIRGGAN